MRKFHIYSGILTTLLACALCLGQSNSGTTIVSGRTHPELISDAIAYLHLFHSLSQAGGESDEQFARRRRAYIGEVGLASDQVESLLTAVALFNDEVGRLDKQPLTPELQAARNLMVMQVVVDLQQKLGAHGAYILSNYVNAVIKPSITMYIRNSSK
jgi:hypothetical protein